MEPDDSDVDETHLLKKQAHEYAGETSIHGLKYIGEKERTKFERWVRCKFIIFSIYFCKKAVSPFNITHVIRIVILLFRILWVVSCIGSVIFCGTMIVPLVNKFDTDPTIISIEDTNYPVWKVPFPAVTICSNNKVIADGFVKALRRPP